MRILNKVPLLLLSIALLVCAYKAYENRINRLEKRGMDSIGKAERDEGPKCWENIGDDPPAWKRSYPCFRDDFVEDGRLIMMVNQDKKRYRALFHTTDYAKYNDSMNVAAQNFIAENNLRVLKIIEKNK